MTRFADTRPTRRTLHNTAVTQLEQQRGWLGGQRHDPQDPSPTRDGYADFSWLLKTAETSCECGAGEHRECECWKRGAA